MSPGLQWFAAVQFALLLAGVASFLWVADTLPFAQAAVGVTALWAGMWALGAAMQARLSVVAVLAVDAVVIATAWGLLLLLR